MPDPSLPAAAQLSPSITSEPTARTHEWYRWREHLLFQNMLEYRHSVESAINSDHIAAGPNGTTIVQEGQRQAAMVPWIFQQLPDITGTDPNAFDLARVEQWSDRTRSLMAMLRAKDSHAALGEARRQWAVFMSTGGTEASQVGWATLWRRSAGQRDQVYLAEVDGYSAATGVVTDSPVDPHRLNDTLRREAGGANEEYEVTNLGATTVDGYDGRVTRTDVDVVLYPFEWASVCRPLVEPPPGGGTPPPDDLIPWPSPHLSGAYEVVVEATATATLTGVEIPVPLGEVGDRIAMMVEAKNYALSAGRPDDVWHVLPLAPLANDGGAPGEWRPIWGASMSDWGGLPTATRGCVHGDRSNSSEVPAHRTELRRSAG